MRLLCLLLGLVALRAARASDLDFIFANQTKRDFEAIYLAVVDDKDWDGNLLRNGTSLKPGGTVQIRFPGKKTSTQWDLNIVDDVGLSLRFHKINLAGVDRIVLVDADGQIRAVVE